MKTLLHSLLFAAALPASLAEAQAPAVPAIPVPGQVPVLAPAATYKPARMISMSPETKRQLVVKTSERNPYARRSAQQENAESGNENAEEIRIRSTLGSLSVSGMSRGQNGLRILLDDIIVEEGRILPKLLPDQSEDLKVVEITEDSLTLAWLDIESGEPTGKTLQIPFDLTPTVTYALHGQAQSTATKVEGETALAERRMGVLRIGQERKIQLRRMAAKDPARNLPREVYEAAQ